RTTIFATVAACARLLIVTRSVLPGAETLSRAVSDYASGRGLSERQTIVLARYLEGWNDKRIAESCRCTQATVYEHWRRMARKCGSRLKSEVVADFHSFLAAGTRVAP